MALTIAVNKDWEVLQHDVETSFLDGSVQEKGLSRSLLATGRPALLPDYLTS